MDNLTISQEPNLNLESKPNFKEHCVNSDFISPLQNKIPKRSIYRYMKIYERTRAKQVQVKLWKAVNCKILELDKSLAQSTNICLIFNKEEIEPSRIVCSSTFKKCLKYVKDLTVANSTIPKSFFAQKLRVKSFTLFRFDLQGFVLNMLKRFVDPKNLKDLTLGSRLHGLNIDQPRHYSKLLTLFPRLRSLFLNGCDVSWKNYNKKFQFLKKLKFPALKALSLNDTHFICWDESQASDYLKYLHQLRALADMRSLHLNLRCQFDLALLAHYQQIESLHLDLFCLEDESMETIFQLPKLKELVIKKFSRGMEYKNTWNPFSQNVTALRPLSLHKLTLHLQPSSRDVIVFSHFLEKITVSDTLDLNCTIYDLEKLLKGNFKLPLQTLRLQIIGPTKYSVFSKALRAIEHFFLQQSTLKSLYISFGVCCSGTVDFLLKAVEKNLSELQSLELSFAEVQKPEYTYTINLQPLLKELKALKAFKLEAFSKYQLTSDELLCIVDGLKEVKTLEKLDLSLDLERLGPTQFKKFVDFMKSVRHLKNLNINVKWGWEGLILLQETLSSGASLCEFPYHCFQPFIRRSSSDFGADESAMEGSDGVEEGNIEENGEGEEDEDDESIEFL